MGSSVTTEKSSDKNKIFDIAIINSLKESERIQASHYFLIGEEESLKQDMTFFNGQKFFNVYIKDDIRR